MPYVTPMKGSLDLQRVKTTDLAISYLWDQHACTFSLLPKSILTIPDTELTQDFHMPRSHHKKYKQWERSSQYPISKIHQSHRIVCQWKLPRWTQDTEFKRTTTNFNKESKEFEEDIKKWFNEIKENKHMSDVQENKTIKKLCPQSVYPQRVLKQR